jgi:hypothetical protein
MALSGEESVSLTRLLANIETWKLLARYWSAIAITAEHEGDLERLELADDEANRSYAMAKILEARAGKAVTA